jgi:hypothetical protein
MERTKVDKLKQARRGGDERPNRKPAARAGAPDSRRGAPRVQAIPIDWRICAALARACLGAVLFLALGA